jgi:hypothetical protein
LIDISDYIAIIISLIAGTLMIITGIYMLYDKYGWSFPQIGTKYTSLNDAVKKTTTTLQKSNNPKHRIYRAIKTSGIEPHIYLAAILGQDGNLYGKVDFSNLSWSH